MVVVVRIFYKKWPLTAHREQQPNQRRPLRTLRSLGKQSSLASYFTRDALAIRRIIEERSWDAKLEESLHSSSIPFSEGLVVEVIKSLSEARLALRFFIWIAQQPHLQQFCLSPAAVDVLSRRWSHEKQFHTFLRTLRLDRKTMNPFSFHVLLNGYGWAGMIEKAVETLESMDSLGINPDFSHFIGVLNILDHYKLFNTLPRVRAKMQQMGVYPDADTYNKLIWGLCTVGQKEDALNLFEEMKKRGETPGDDAYKILISMFNKANKPHEVLQIFNALLDDGVEPDIKSYNALIRALCLVGKHLEALEVVEMVLDKSLKPNLVSLTMLTDKLFESGELDKLLCLWMKLQKISFPTVTFQDRLISEFHSAGRSAEIEEILAAHHGRLEANVNAP
ncbi:hypothetical protein KP509_23G032900 [Ceratopteris richardii]|uniref:Pentatricopeptide repeat-containing protein n=1 Tax=Ceratopteris richardii TaxID=49495 RepID=A0A8T2S0X6_CERRI|nr:hypothetical protein KP509_23G032900 [Ceratopteris richardii]